MSDASNPFRYGGFWLRVAAYIIDAIILTIIAGIVGGIIGGIVGVSVGANVDALVGAQVGIYLILVPIVWLYFAISESSAWRATIGKKACGMIVTDEQGRQISFGRATGRYFAKFVSGLILLIGYLMVGWNHQKRGLHDMIAGTYVLKRNSDVAANEVVALPA